MRINVGGVVLNKAGKVAVVSQHGRAWSLPKGGLEKGESLLDGARREIFEEIGLRDLELLAPHAIGQYERTKIFLPHEKEDPSSIRQMNFFLFRAHEDDFILGDSETPEALWVDREEVATILTHPKDKEFFLGIKDSLPK